MNTNFVEAPAGRQRRRYSVEIKAGASKACKAGISMAAVALANRLNANMLRKWVSEARVPTESLLPVNIQSKEPLPAPPSPGVVALRLPEPAPRADLLLSIHLDVQRADLTIKITWPVFGERVFCLAARVAAMIRIDAVWLATDDSTVRYFRLLPCAAIACSCLAWLARYSAC